MRFVSYLEYDGKILKTRFSGPHKAKLGRGKIILELDVTNIEMDDVSVKSKVHTILLTAVKRSERSRNMENTQRSLERLLFHVVNGRACTENEHKMIHEVVLHNFAPRIEVMGATIPKRSSDMSKFEYMQMMQGTINLIMDYGVPKVLADHYHSMGENISDLFSWFYQESNDSDLQLDWDEYRQMRPYCEWTFQKGTDSDPLERQHIVSAGQAKHVYEESWNWIHARHSVHMLQHQYGWAFVLEKYPHMKNKIETARRMYALRNQSD